MIESGSSRPQRISDQLKFWRRQFVSDNDAWNLGSNQIYVFKFFTSVFIKIHLNTTSFNLVLIIGMCN